MPRELFGPGFEFLPNSEVLSFEEITRLARLFVAEGVRKIRLTGGEPLLRRELPTLVAMIAAIPNVDLTLTTNGSLLEQQAAALAAAGLRRVTVSLDALDDGVFQAMNDASFPVAKVLAGIDAAAAAGLRPVKVNAVVRRGMNDAAILQMARYFKGTGHVLRFIEYMDVGHSNGWCLDEVVPAAEIVERIDAELPLEPLEPNYRGEVAARYRYRDGAGEIGVIASVTQPFCGDCTRARLSADGKLYTCLFASVGQDLRRLLRDGTDDAMLSRLIRRTWNAREDRYSEIRSSQTADPSRIEMSYIGG